MEKVYIVTEAFPMQAEEYTKGNVHSTFKKAEKAVRTKYPHARKEDSTEKEVCTYTCDSQSTKLVFIHTENVA